MTRVVSLLRFLGARPAGCFFALALLLWLFVKNDYGATWDETPHAVYGERVRAFLFSDQTYADFKASLIPKQEFYSPVVDLAGALIGHHFGLREFAAKHAAQGLLWTTLFFPVCALGRRLAGNRGAWFAGLAAFTTPILLGHAFNNPKDMPLAIAAIWLAAVAAWAAAARPFRWPHLLGLGSAFGFVLMVRPGAWFLGALIGLVVWDRLLTVGPLRQRLLAAARTLPWLLGCVVIAWALMCALWPYAWQSPVANPLQAMSFARRFDEVYPVLFGGVTYPSNELPRGYLPGYLLLTSPIPHLLAALVALATLRQWKTPRRSVPLSGLVFLLGLPLVYCPLFRPNIYDGLRHFLFMIPALAVLAGAGAARVVQLLARVRAPYWLAIPAPAAALLASVPAMVALHPYQSTYYNLAAGPRETLHRRYETDYWISSYREAAEWINARQAASDRPIRVALTATSFSYQAFAHYLDPRVQTAWFMAKVNDRELPPSLDYYVSTVRYGLAENFSHAPVVEVIGRDGITYTVIKSRSR